VAIGRYSGSSRGVDHGGNPIFARAMVTDQV
jgi:hypothetical protein